MKSKSHKPGPSNTGAALAHSEHEEQVDTVGGNY